jgi:hypothetical protein
MPGRGQTTKSKHYWIGIITAVLRQMPEKYIHQDVIDFINAKTGPHPFGVPADSTISSHIKEIRESSVDNPWMDGPWSMGVVQRLEIFGTKLDANSLRVINDVYGYALTRNLGLSTRHAVWISRLYEIFGHTEDRVLGHLYSRAGRYADAERAAIVLNEPMNSELLDAQMALDHRPGRILPAYQMFLAASTELTEQAINLTVESIQKGYEDQDSRSGTDPVEWLADCELERFDHAGKRDAVQLAIRAFIRKELDLMSTFDDAKARVIEIYKFVENDQWDQLYESFAHEETYGRAVNIQQAMEMELSDEGR